MSGGRYWVKLWIEMLDDPKVASLPDRLWRRWVETLMLAKVAGDDGHLDELRTMAWRLRLSAEELESDLVELARVGLVEQMEGVWRVPKFAERQAPRAGAQRQRISRRWRSCHSRVTAVSQHADTEEEEEDRGRGQRTEAEEEAEGFGVVVTAWEAAAGPITPMVAEHLADLAGEAESHRRTLPAESAGALADGCTWVVEAIRSAAESATGPLSVAFVRAILARWMREGFRAPRRGVRSGRSPVLDPDSEEARRRYVQGRFAEFVEH